jgi:hypothetical protein
MAPTGGRTGSWEATFRGGRVMGMLISRGLVPAPPPSQLRTHNNSEYRVFMSPIAPVESNQGH